jgi:crotonobetainyl-CoA:carnitine CoA-transferase CaiB-like acyl-CoA transferase
MKLEGIRVIDLSVFLPGPYLTLAMADHGAEVIKVEPPGEGDPGRHIGLSDGPSTVFFRNLNRGKKSVVIDLKDGAQREALLSLCDTADVFVESFRPGAVDRLGVGYDAVRARNPRIVYCSISAFGQDSEWRGRPAHDLALEAESGLVSMTLGNDGKPAISGLPGADVLAGLQGLSGVLMALLRRERTGLGDYIDRRHLVLAGQEPKFIHNLLRAFGRPELAELCLRGPGPHQKPVIDFLAAEFGKKTLAEWQEFLSTLDVCYGRVNTLPEAFAHPNLVARGMVRRDAMGRRHVGPPIRFRHEPAQPVLREPMLGEHTSSILKRTSE